MEDIPGGGAVDGTLNEDGGGEEVDVETVWILIKVSR